MQETNKGKRLVKTLTTKDSNIKLGLTTQNGESISVSKGTPIILTVVAYNGEAEQTAGANAAIMRAIEQAEDQMSQGKITNEEFTMQTAELNKGIAEPTPTTIGSKNSPWYNSIKFFEVQDDDKQRPLKWPLTIMSKPKPQPTVTLGAHNIAQASFGLDPEQVQKLNVGKKKIISQLGDATSNQVKVEIQEETKELRSNIPLANYYYQQEQYDKAVKLVQEELTLDPSSIAGHFLLAEIREEQGDLESAMQSYLQALANFESRRTEATQEDPDVLLQKIQNLGYRMQKQTKL